MSEQIHGLREKGSGMVLMRSWKENEQFKVQNNEMSLIVARIIHKDRNVWILTVNHVLYKIDLIRFP